MSEQEETILGSEVVTEAPEGTAPEEQSEAAVADTGWMLSEGVNGEGDTPDWFKAGKYKTVADQAQAYAGLESKLGGFTGAPDEYTVALDEALGYQIPDDDPMLGDFNKWAKEAGLSQDSHTKLLNMYVENTAGQMENFSVEEEIKKIGDNSQQRIQDVTHWGQANLDANEYATLQEMATTADGFHLIEKLKQMSRETQVSAPDTAKPVDTMTEQKLYEMIGDKRYESNPSYRSEVEAKFRDYYGSAPANKVKS